jgi:hypothetical protein
MQLYDEMYCEHQRRWNNGDEVMQVNTDVMKQFNRIAGIGSMGNFEAKRVEDKLVASIATPTVLIRAEMKSEFAGEEDFVMFASEGTFNEKYLSNFNGKDTLTISTNEDAILVSDGKLEMTMPQLAAEVAKKNTKEVASPKGVDFTNAIKVTFPFDDMKKSLAIAKTLQEMFIQLTIGDDLKFFICNKARLTSDAEISARPEKEKTVFIKLDTADFAFVGAKDLITLEVTPGEKLAPVKFSYTSGDSINVVGYFVPFNPKVEEGSPDEVTKKRQDGEKKKASCAPKK